MTFDPLADVIDLRDVLEIAENDPDDAGVDARVFLVSLYDGLYGGRADEFEVIADYVRGIADNEPTVITRRYFVEYAQDLADDIGALGFDTNLAWPLYCIDWERAAKDLEADYSTFTYDGREYLIRSA